MFERAAIYAPLQMLSRTTRSTLVQCRSLLRPPPNKPYRGIYRKDGEAVCEGDLLVCQHKFNYVPGMNVYHEMDRGQNLLKASCDGIVRISTEWLERNEENAWIGKAINEGLEKRPKMTFNVVRDKPSNRFTLTSLV